MAVADDVTELLIGSVLISRARPETRVGGVLRRDTWRTGGSVDAVRCIFCAVLLT
jgi:hypothetical protein